MNETCLTPALANIYVSEGKNIYCLSPFLDERAFSTILFSMLTCYLFIFWILFYLYACHSIEFYINKIKYVNKIEFELICLYLHIAYPNWIQLRSCPRSGIGLAAQAPVKLCSLKGSSGFNSLTAQMKPMIMIWPRWPRVEDLLKISEGTDANHRNTSDRRRNGNDDNPLRTSRAEDHEDMTLKIRLRQRR